MAENGALPTQAHACASEIFPSQNQSDWKKRGIAKSAFVVAFFTLLSRVAGLVRDMVVFHVFGATGATDAFFVALTIPNILRRFVAEGAMTVSFVPIYTEVRETEGKASAKEFLAQTFGLLLLAVPAIVVIGILASKWVVLGFASGFQADSEKLALAVDLTRLLRPV